MLSERVKETAETGATTTGRPRVLVVRCCRTPQFAAAVALARTRHPQVEVVALSHQGFQEALRAAGADRVIEIPGCRFGLLRISPAWIARLRQEGFAEVIVPQMTGFGELHSNVYRVVAALLPPRMVVVPGDGAPEVIEARSIRRFALRQSLAAVLARCDTPSFLALLAAACIAPRRRSAGAVGRPRVLHIISSFGVGGAQVQLAELLNRTPVGEYDVELVVLGRDDGEFSRQWLTRADVPVSYVQRWPKLALSVFELAAKIRAGRYDMVHTWLFMANMVGGAAARLAGVPFVLASVRNLSVWKREAVHRQWWHRVGDALGSRAADLVTVNARALVRDHARWALMPARNIRVVHNGLDPSAFFVDRPASRARLLELTGAAEDSLFVGTVGRLAQEKDQATFLRLLADVRRVRSTVHGVIVGHGEMRAGLERLAAELDLTGAVTFLGQRADARRLAAGFDVFALTSRSEGFPNVLLEATFMRVPCVATDIAGNPDVLGEDDVLFPVGDFARGAARVLAVLGAPEQTSARAERARERALGLFTSEQSVAAWLRLYRECLGPADAAVAVGPLNGTERAA